jgi:hypothetical protein
VINHIPTKGLSPPIVDHTLAMAGRRRSGGLFAASAKPEGDCDEIVAPSMLKPLSDGVVVQGGPGKGLSASAMESRQRGASILGTAASDKERNDDYGRDHSAAR